MAYNATCKSCGAPMTWIRTRGGKWMPCDAAPIRFRKGGDELFVTAKGDVVRGTRDEEGTLLGRSSHFATCPNAAQHRRGG